MNIGWDSKHLESQNFHVKESKNSEKANYLDEPQCFYARKKDKNTGENIWIQQLPKQNSGKLVFHASELTNDLLTLQFLSKLVNLRNLLKDTTLKV